MGDAVPGVDAAEDAEEVPLPRRPVGDARVAEQPGEGRPEAAPHEQQRDRGSRPLAVGRAA